MDQTSSARKNAHSAERVAGEVKKVNEEHIDPDPDSDFSTESVPVKKPRRKSQAFGVPKTAALKAKIDRNAAESPLLSLPREIRARIWKLLIGDRLLHMAKKGTCAEHDEARNCLCTEKAWTTFCCLSPYSEEELYQRSRIPIGELIDRDEAQYGAIIGPFDLQPLPDDPVKRREARKLYLEKHPHHFCQQFITDLHAKRCNELQGHQLAVYKNKEHVLSMQLLRVCRQVYIEAHPVLWSTNTLSFRNPNHFNKFMSERIAAQKAAITSLVIDLSWSWSRCSWRGEGQRAATSGIVTSLVGLQTLHLYLEQALDRWGSQNAPSSSNEVDIERWWSNTKAYEENEGFTNFKRLPIKNVTVIMFDNNSWGSQIELAPWYCVEKMKYTEAVRQEILDPEGKQKFEQEQADAKVAREAEIERLKLIWLPCQMASTSEECARLKQQGKSVRAKIRIRACNAEHVCLVCLNQLQRTRVEARNCPKLGKCTSGYFKIMFNNTWLTDNSMEALVHPNETTRNVLARYVSLSGIEKCVPWVLHYQGTQLNPETTVKEIGLKKSVSVDVNILVERTSQAKTAPTPGSDDDLLLSE